MEQPPSLLLKEITEHAKKISAGLICEVQYMAKSVANHSMIH